MPITSNSATPVPVTSPDSLANKGVGLEQLADYVERQLGAPTWNVELSRQQILDTINDALTLWSIWVPLRRAQSIILVQGQFRYLEGVDVGQGIAEVSFVEPNPVPTEIFYGNLINPAPIFRLGLDEYDTFLRWRKTWMRVTSVQPNWMYDDVDSCLYIHNPIERYMCGVICYFDVTDPRALDSVGSQWVKRYSVAKANMLLGQQWMKFSGAIPGPVQNLQLDQERRRMWTDEMNRLEAELKAMQRSAPLTVD
jgi:hypothetical protein